MRLVTIFAALVIAALSHGQLSGQGTLLDSAGAPVVGADVITSRRYPPDYMQIIYRTKTDSQGHFKLESINAKKLPDYALLFVKTRSGMVSLANESDSQGVWNLAPPVNYRFTVKDKDGKPLAKAMIKPHYFWVPAKPSGSIQADYPAESSRWDNATTGADGTATFQGLGMEVTQFGSGEESGEVEVSCPGMADERVSVNKDKPSVTVTLNPGANLGGRLLDAHGRGVGGVDIRVKSDAASDVTVTTDNTGAYSAKGLKPGVYDLEPLLGPLSQNWAAKPIDRVLVAGGQELDGLDFQMDPGVLIKGRTTVLETGKPFPGAFVSLSRREGFIDAGSVTTGATGDFEFRTFPGEHYISVRFAPGGSVDDCNCDEVIAPGNSPFVELRIPKDMLKAPLKEMAGTVVDAAGNPVAGAEVGLLNMKSFGLHQAVSDSSGHFVCEGPVSPGASFFAVKGDDATASPVEFTGEQTSISLKLVEHGACALSGRILKEDGSPMAGLKVTEDLWQGNAGISIKNTLTNADGRFTFDAQPPGIYSLGANPQGYVPLSLGATAIAASEAHQVGDLTIQAANSSVSGQVLNDKGKPLGGVLVRYNQWIAANTDAGGQFRLGGLPKGKVHLDCSGPGMSMGFDVQSDSEPVSITMHPLPPPEPAGTVSKPFAQFVGLAAPELKIAKWLNSIPYSLAKLRGKVVVLDFWATSCGPCVAAMPDVQKLSLAKPSDVVVIGIDAWGEPTDKVLRVMKEHGVTYPMGLDSVSNGLSVTVNAYPVQGIPTVVVIGRDGKVAGITHDIFEARALALSLAK